MRHDVQKKLVGVQAIGVTPFKENGDVDYDAFERNIDFQIRSGIRWITCGGTVGEFSTLTQEEYKRVIETVCGIVAGRGVAMVPCAASTSLRNVVELCNAAEKCGADAMLVPPPYYGGCSFESIYAFFRKVMEYTSLPLQLYYYPEAQGVKLTVNQLKELLALERFVSVKETSNHIPTSVLLTGLLGEEINFISGSGEYHVPDAMLFGEKGFTSSMANYLPKVPVKIWEAIEKKEYEKAAAMRRALEPLLYQLQNSAAFDIIKGVMNARGLRGGTVRVPNLQSDSESLDMILRTVEELDNHPIFA